MKYAFIFPGQGSQSAGMGKALHDEFALAREYFSNASDILGLDMQDLLFNPNDKLNLTQYTQPAIFLVSFIAYNIFQSQFKLKPAVALGHSLGEITAVAISGALSFENALKLTFKRGELMAKACECAEAGMMVIVGLDDSTLESFCEKAREKGKSIWCANYNGDGQVVLAGKKAHLSAVEGELKALGAKRALLLPMSVASHCPMLDSILKPFGDLLESTLENHFSFPILSNATMEYYDTKQKAKELLTSQLTSPVRYKQSIEKIHNDISGFIEFGNGAVLKGLNKRLSSHTTLNVSDVESLKHTLESLQGIL